MEICARDVPVSRKSLLRPYLQPTVHTTARRAAGCRHATHEVFGKGPNETCDILVPNELKNAERLTVGLRTIRPTMKWSYRLTAIAVVLDYVKFQHFERSLMFIAQTM